jgi:hypothetical protein
MATTPAAALERSLTNIPPTSPKTIGRMEYLRSAAKSYGYALLASAPEGRERSLAVTKLEESLMWAIKAIVLAQDDEGEGELAGQLDITEVLD